MNIEDWKNFEDWKKEYGLVYEPNYSLHTEMDCLAAFKAGQQSKQHDIETLENIIKVISDTADWHIEDCACSHPMSQRELGWLEAMSLIKKKLGEYK